MTPPRCRRCDGRMVEGHIIDTGQSSMVAALSWHPGAPDKRWWGYKTDKAAKRRIVSWRCERCGLLEDYAP